MTLSRDGVAVSHSGRTPPEVIRDECARSVEKLISFLGGMSAPDLERDCGLPGWRRRDVLAHLTVLTGACTRQIDACTVGRAVPMYAGGTDEKEDRRETAAAMPTYALVQTFTDEAWALTTRWAEIEPSRWWQPVGYRAGVLVDVLLCWWREITLHLVDLGDPDGSQGIPELARHHLIDHLCRRLPSPHPLLVATDSGHRWAGEHPTSAIRASEPDIVMFLAGRSPGRSVVAEDDTREPLVLGPWP